MSPAATSDVFRSRESTVGKLGGKGVDITDDFQVISANTCWDRTVGS